MTLHAPGAMGAVRGGFDPATASATWQFRIGAFIAGDEKALGRKGQDG